MGIRSRVFRPRRGKAVDRGQDLQTRKYYSENAPEIARRYASVSGGIDSWFDVAFPKGSHVLDVGCAAGRDVLLLLKGGWDAYGVDPCADLIDEGFRTGPALKGRLSCDALPELQSIPDQSFEGVLCSAVLMHLPEEMLFDAAFGLRRVLKPGGRLLVSLPLDTNGNPVTGRDQKERFFNGLSPDRLELLLSRLGFTCIGRGENADTLGRDDRKWVVLLFALGSDGAERSIDRIESVLNRDHKVATYKLALFRALAEIGMTQYNRAAWLADGRVAVPINVVAEKWLEYYWPIVSCGTFIPQINGEKPSSPKPIAFRRLMQDLAEKFRSRGGLTGFLIAKRSGKLDMEENDLYCQLMGKLINTIRVGPVRYSGGGGTSLQIFSYEPSSGCILMERGIWQEFCLMGSWVRDATILRWAELTERLSRNEVTVGRVIGLLIEDPLPEREVSDARDLFRKAEITESVWSGAPLAKRNFDVDHAIPFSLWHCNDLWNLFPVNSSENRNKKDKLPSRRLILGRKGAICQTWERTFEALPVRFRTEASSFAGAQITDEPRWPDLLFSLFAEAVEVTAIQRGAERWEP